MKEIILVGGLIALVDDVDFDTVSSMVWYKSHPKRSKTPYAKANPQGGNIYMHRLVLGFPESHIDHKNGNGLDCRKSNLRPATRTQNNANIKQKKRGGVSTSKFTGVHKHHTGKWCARVHVRSKVINLGLFVSEDDAARARDCAALELWGEFAMLNFPKEERLS